MNLAGRVKGGGGSRMGGSSMRLALFLGLLGLSRADDADVLRAIRPTPRGWDGGGDPCSWPGVTCNDEKRVTTLYLDHNRLTALPESFGDLTQLTTLDLDLCT